MEPISTSGFLKNSTKLSIPTIAIRLFCIYAAVELIYQIFELFINSRGTIYLIHPWYYTFSFITTFLSIPLLIYIWRLKTWAMPVLLLLTVINQSLWFSFGVWDYRMTIFPVLFLLVWLWQVADRKLTFFV